MNAMNPNQRTLDVGAIAPSAAVARPPEPAKRRPRRTPEPPRTIVVPHADWMWHKPSGLHLFCLQRSVPPKQEAQYLLVQRDGTPFEAPEPDVLHALDEGVPLEAAFAFLQPSMRQTIESFHLPQETETVALQAWGRHVHEHPLYATGSQETGTWRLSLVEIRAPSRQRLTLTHVATGEGAEFAHSSRVLDASLRTVLERARKVAATPSPFPDCRDDPDTMTRLLQQLDPLVEEAQRYWNQDAPDRADSPSHGVATKGPLERCDLRERLDWHEVEYEPDTLWKQHRHWWAFQTPSAPAEFLERFNEAVARAQLERRFAILRRVAEESAALFRWSRQPTPDHHWPWEDRWGSGLSLVRLMERLREAHEGLRDAAPGVPPNTTLAQTLDALRRALEEPLGSPLLVEANLERRILMTLRGELKPRRGGRRRREPVQTPDPETDPDDS